MKVRDIGCLVALFCVAGLTGMDSNPTQELRNAIRKTVLTSNASDVDFDQILAKKPGFEPNILFLFRSDKPALITILKKFLAYCDTCDPERSWRPVVLSHKEHGITPLHAAVIAGNCNMVQALIEEGADVQIEAELDTHTRGPWPLTTAVRRYCTRFQYVPNPGIASRYTDQQNIDNYAQIIQILNKHTVFKSIGWHWNWQYIKDTVGELFYLDGRTVLPAVGPTGGVKYLLPDCLKFVESEWPKGEPATPTIAVPVAPNPTRNQNSISNGSIQSPTVGNNSLGSDVAHNANQPKLNPHQTPKKQADFSFTRSMQNKYFLGSICAFLFVCLAAYKYLHAEQENDDETEAEDQNMQTTD